MTLLNLLKEFCGRTSITQPTVVFGSQNTQIMQLVALANEGLEDMTTRHSWQALQHECLHTALAAEDQGALVTLAPQGFQYIIDNKLYNRTTNTLLLGPVSTEEWQQLKAGVGVGTGSWRIRQGHLLIIPNPTAGHVMAFEYASNYAVLAADGMTYKPYFTADDDSCVLPDVLMLLWLRWRWKKEKGFSYDEDFRLYESALTNIGSHDGNGKVLDMSAGVATGPGIFVQSGMYVPSA